MNEINTTELETKNKEYLAYINEHRANVHKAFDIYGKSIADELDMSFKEYFALVGIVSHHDDSKYLAEEFDGYRQWFYPLANETKNRKIFDKAWKHHYTLNRHHWEYYYNADTNTATEIPKIYLAELILDWTAMSFKFGDTPYLYYKKNYRKIHLNYKTKLILVRTLKKLFSGVDSLNAEVGK